MFRDNETFNLLVICGPTASGKTSLAVQLALDFQGEIISADSRQVYQGMDIGTGKDLHEYETSRGRVSYHLIDIVPPSSVYTLYHYQRDCYAVLDELQHKKCLPILTGGTGLYIEAVLKGYDIPNVPENVTFRKAVQDVPHHKLIQKLSHLDPSLLAKTDINSKKRVIRALEIHYFSRHHELVYSVSPREKITPFILGTLWSRVALRRRITKRLHDRFAEGMLDEIEKLLHSGILRERFDLFGMEYKYGALYLEGKMSYETMFSRLETAIHRLAKRQETYFRGMVRRGFPIKWVHNAEIDAARAMVKSWILLRQDQENE